MDGSNQYSRPRNQTNGSVSSGRPSHEVRRGPGPGAPPSQPPSLTRAERFEDEKRRIIDSCFSKVDTNGQLTESYITHIRVTEDAQFPQHPPPPDSPPQNKKLRVIIIAVRNTGRVRMHKARENANTTFSIGKTWNLEELTAVQSYSNLTPTNDEEARRKEWAGDMGFIVSLAKQYYWQAGTPKEKEFFIASLVKIYRKYTQGKVPHLHGFNSREIDQMLGFPQPQGGQRPPGPPRPSPPGSGYGRPPRPPQSASPNMGLRPSPEPPHLQHRHPSAPGPRPPTGSDERLPGPRGPPSSGQPPVPLYSQQGRQPRPRPSQERELRQPPSREQMPPPTQIPPYASAQRLTPQSSRSEIATKRSASPDGSSISSRAPSIPPQQSPERQRQYQPPPLDRQRPDQPPMDGPSLAASTIERWKTNGAPPADRRAPSPGRRAPTPHDEAPAVPSRPERKRPPLLETDSASLQRSVERDQNYVAPLVSPRPRLGRGPSPGGTNGARFQEPRMPGGFIPSPAPSESSKVAEEAPVSPVKEQPSDSLPSTIEPPKPQDPAVQRAPSPVSPLGTPPRPPSPRAPSPEPVVAPPVRPPSPSKDDDDEEQFRPGLGPMIKKKNGKDVANVLRKAANAYGAFKPRAGGAGEKLLKTDNKSTNEPDGISSVVPAPSLLKAKSPEKEKAGVTLKDEPVPAPEKQEVPTVSTEDVPKVTVSSPQSATPAEEKTEPTRSPSAAKPKPKASDEARKLRRRSNQQAKHLAALGVDPGILDNRGLEFEAILGDFGWGATTLQPKKIEVLEAEIRREIGRVEAGSWLGNLEHKDDRVEAVEKLLDRAIAECEELEGLLTLYGVELSSLNEDIAFIEAQSQGLQVQTANQKLLQSELQSLVDTISIDANQLEALRRAQIGKVEGLESIESALLLLYKAMITIDPALRQQSSSGNDNASITGINNNELASMRALQQKKEGYMTESVIFLDRLTKFMDMTFGAALLNTKDALKENVSSTKLDAAAHDLARDELWQYSPLILFAKEVNTAAWEDLVKLYQKRAQALYQEAIHDNMLAWKKTARKLTGDEQDVLFTSQEKESDGTLNTTNRKQTVKRTLTLARTLRSASGEKSSSGDKNQSGKLFPFEVFSGALNEQTPLIFTEQNFVVDFFHATSSDTLDFADAVVAASPALRRGTNLQARKLFEPDRAMAKRVAEIMEEVYTNWPTELQNLVEWAIKADPLQGVGILAAIEQKILDLEDTNQEYLTRTLQKVHTRLAGLFTRFVDEQIRAIEDTKVKIKKRKGVIGFIKVFPHFAAAIENMIPSAASASEDDSQRLDVRPMVEEAYQKINKAMFESLKVIAKESPGVTAAHGQAGADPEDKEALNYHILLIENMNHYIEEVDERSDSVLAEWRTKAEQEMAEHMKLYVDAVIRRPLGKLLDFLDTTTPLLSGLPADQSASSIASKPSHSRAIFRKLLDSHDSKDLRRGIDALKKRVDKHFGDADDPSISRSLVAKVVKACEERFVETRSRVREVGERVYGGDADEGGKEGKEKEWEGWGDDVEGWFRR